MVFDSFGYMCGFFIYICYDDGDWFLIKNNFLF